MGNPNVGKSVFFSRLTAARVISSNYSGTTVGFTRGYTLIKGEKYEIIDVPGTYTLTPTCKAEEVACEILKTAGEGDLIIDVVDATNLERNLYLALEIMEQPVPVIVALNMWDETKHRGIHIDVEKLEKWLGVPVVPTTAIAGEGFARLISRIDDARSPEVRKHSLEERWKDIGRVISEVQHLEHRHHTLGEIVHDLTIKPVTAIPCAIVVVWLSFMATRFIGEGIVRWIADPFFEGVWLPLLMKISTALHSGGLIHDILIGKLIDGKIDFVQSFGVLSTALYVEFAMVLPYIVAFYFILGVLEDSGYLPRIAVLMDTLMHKIGLHGFAIIPTLLSFGCNVPGILATRVLESRRERFIAATLISISVPCAALQAMIIGILGKYGGGKVLIVYATLAATWFVLGFMLNRVTKGFSPELLLEIPAYRFPSPSMLLKKTWWRIGEFIKEALPVVTGGVLVINVLYLLHAFDYVASLTAPVITGLLGLPKESIVAILTGFLRKDVAVGMLAPLALTAKQLIVACVVLSMFFPCIATFVVLLKELGYRDMLKSTGIMIFASLLVGSLLNLIL
jgi:ferrous iron transport protein B